MLGSIFVLDPVPVRPLGNHRPCENAAAHEMLVQFLMEEWVVVVIIILTTMLLLLLLLLLLLYTYASVIATVCRWPPSHHCDCSSVMFR